MKLLPLTAAHVARVADRKPMPGYATGSVRVELDQEADTYTVAAATKDVMLVGRGPCLPQDKYPVPAVMNAYPNGAAVALVDHEQWERFFKSSTTLLRKADRQVQAVGVQPGESTCTLVATDGVQTPVASLQSVGRFPDVPSILNAAREEVAGGITVRLPVAALFKLVAAVKAMGEDDTVTMQIGGPGKLVLVTATGQDGMSIEGVLITRK